MTQDNIQRFKALLNKFHDKVIATDDQIKIMYEFIYESKFYPLKEKLAVRNSIIKTVLYLKDMSTRSGYDTLDKIEQYFDKRRDEIKALFRNLDQQQ